MRLASQVDSENGPILSAPPAEMAPFADIPHGVWIAFLSVWGLLFGIFIFAFATDGPAALVVLTATFFAIMTLGLPTVLCGHAKRATRQCPQVIATRNGPLPLAAAATQILLIPVGTVLGLTAFIVLAM
jgi:hypothetical protein